MAEIIFLNLSYEKLKICQMINQTSYQILNDNPILWIMFIWRKLSEENQKYLIRAFQCMNFNKENHMVTYLRWNLKNKNFLLLPQDLLSYTSPVVQSDLRQKIYQAAQNGSTKIVEISVTKNPHCAGARTVPALYGCGPHSNLMFKGYWTLIFRKKFEKKKIFFSLFFFLFRK